MVRTVLAVDGNSLVHRAFHSQAATGLRTPAGEPIWAVRGLVSAVLDAVDRLAPDAVVVGFDDPDASVRRQRWPQYKAQRAEKLPTLVSQLVLAARTLAELGIPVVIPTGLEADDVLAAAAAVARRDGHRAVVMTSDRDAFALIDESCSVLRILNGGVESSPLLTPPRLQLLLGIRPGQYRDFAALRGDPSDNLPGVRGIGPKTATALLTALGSAKAAFDDLAVGGGVVAAAVGPAAARKLSEPAARAAWQLNCEVMAHLPAELPALRTIWPLDAQVVRRVFTRLQLPATLKHAMRVFADTTETSRPAPVVVSVVEPVRLADRGRRRHPPLPMPVQSDQLALFAI